jgi:SAM-dependent methyltransferase
MAFLLGHGCRSAPWPVAFFASLVRVPALAAVPLSRGGDMASTSKAWGQNFLKSRKLAAALVADSGIDRDDEVYEIGSGKGIITRELARRAGKVVAVERDPDLAARLKRRFDGEERVEIRCADFLDIPLRKARYKIFGNIPFNITTAVIDKITSATRPPQDTWLLVQKEAGRRFAGRPRTTLFSALAGPFFELSLGRMVRRTEFDPNRRWMRSCCGSGAAKNRWSRRDTQTGTGNSSAGVLKFRSGISSGPTSISSPMSSGDG